MCMSHNTFRDMQEKVKLHTKQRLDQAAWGGGRFLPISKYGDQQNSEYHNKSPL